MKAILLLLAAIYFLNAETFTKSLDNIGWHSIGIPINSIEVNSSTFPDSVSVVWKWNNQSQSWEFYSANDTLKTLATSINVPVISTLNKGDAVWIKSTGSSDSVSFENNITNEYVSQDPSDYDTSVLKIGSTGQILEDTATQWKAIYIKEVGLWIENKTTFTGGQQFSFTEARSYCSTLELAGKTDWYLPVISELSGLGSILESNATLLQNIQTSGSDFYWSNDSSSNAGYYQTFRFYDNLQSNSYITTANYVVCFRKNQ